MGLQLLCLYCNGCSPSFPVNGCTSFMELCCEVTLRRKGPPPSLSSSSTRHASTHTSFARLLDICAVTSRINRTCYFPRHHLPRAWRPEQSAGGTAVPAPRATEGRSEGTVRVGSGQYVVQVLQGYPDHLLTFNCAADPADVVRLPDVTELSCSGVRIDSHFPRCCFTECYPGCLPGQACRTGGHCRGDGVYHGERGDWHRRGFPGGWQGGECFQSGRSR